MGKFLDKFFGLETPEMPKADEPYSFLISAYSNEELAVFRSILESAEIPYMYKERGSGSSVKIITGYSMFGTDIYVPNSMLEVATQLMVPADAEVLAEDVEPDAAVENAESDEEEAEEEN